MTLPSEAEILDRSKSDSLAKAIVIIQTLWFATQCIARLERLAINRGAGICCDWPGHVHCMVGQARMSNPSVPRVKKEQFC